MGNRGQASRSTRARGAWSLGLGIAVALLICALPTVAAAADYCVAPNANCGVNNVSTFGQALASAGTAADADRIFLAAATYTAPTADGFTYAYSNSPVEIIGQGVGQTILTGLPGGTNVLRLYGGAGTSVHDLTVRLPQNAAAGHQGLDTQNTARRIDVIEDPVQANNWLWGVVLSDGGTLEDSSVTLDGSQDTSAVILHHGGSSVRRSVLSARTGVHGIYGGAIERSRVTGSQYGVWALGGATAINSSVIRLTGTSGTGIRADTQQWAHPTVNADGVTIVGQGLPDIAGAGVRTASAPAESASINLTNSVIRGVGTALYATAGGTGKATVSASYSDYESSGNVALGANASITEASVSNVGDAGFVDALGGNFRPRAGSPLLDKGDPATPQGLDFDGNLLVADGDADGVARRDLGAFEAQPASSAGNAQPPTDGGQRVAGGDQPVIGAGQQVGIAAPGMRASLVSGFRAAPSLFAIARAGTPLAARVARGTSFRYVLSESARVTLTLQRVLPGRRAGSKCLRPTRQLHRARPCTRHRTVGTLSRTGTKGANSIRFSGRIGSRALRPGRYRAVITATDGAGNRSAPRAARFRVARG